MKVDPKFTKKIQDWLNKEPKEKEDALTGAQLLQQINPRNAMYRRFINLSIQRPLQILPKIIYELKTHLKYRLDGLTLEEVNRLDREVVPAAAKIIAKGKPAADEDDLLTDEQGQTIVPAQVVIAPILSPDDRETNVVKQLGRRADHEQLPDDIKALWDNNGTLYKDIKSTFEELKSMEDLPSCQRYDKLQLLASMDQKYFRQMKEYDDYVIDSEKIEKKEEPEQKKEVKITVPAARSYISKNQAKLADLHKAAHVDGASVKDINAYQDLVIKVQARVNVLIAANEVTDKMKESLSVIGIVFDTPVPDESEAASDNAETAG